MDDDEDNYHALVLDNGTRRIKVGFAGDDAPRDMFLNMTGTTSDDHQESADVYVGDKAQKMKELCSLNFPMEHGIVVDWDAMERVWTQAFSVCQRHPFNGETVCPNLPVLITDPPFNPKCHREMMAEVMFEVLDRPAIDVVLPTVLAAYSHGRNTSLCVDIGDGVSSVYPVYESYTPMAAVMRSDLAGRDLTDFLMKDLSIERGISLSTASEREKVYEMKEKEELLLPQNYKTRSGETISFTNELFAKCPEILFNPEKYGFKAPSIQQMVHDSLMNCDADKRSLLANNIMLSGGTTMFSGFDRRLAGELKKILPSGMRICVRAPPERSYSVWIGGSVLASLSRHENAWITKEMYEEFGPTVVLRNILL